jgi:hypothetical protein
MYYIYSLSLNTNMLHCTFIVHEINIISGARSYGKF